MDIWTIDDHEIAIGQQGYNNIQFGNIEEQLRNLAQNSGLKIEQLNFESLQVFNKNETQTLVDVNIEKLPSNLSSVFLVLIQFDLTFKTKILTRLIYPLQSNALLKNTQGIHLVKLILNGCRRAVIVQQDEQLIANQQ